MPCLHKDKKFGAILYRSQYTDTVGGCRTTLGEAGLVDKGYLREGGGVREHFTDVLTA